MTDTPKYQVLTTEQLERLGQRIRICAEYTPYEWTEQAIVDAHLLAARIYTAVLQSGISPREWDDVAPTAAQALQAIRDRDMRRLHAQALADGSEWA